MLPLKPPFGIQKFQLSFPNNLVPSCILVFHTRLLLTEAARFFGSPVVRIRISAHVTTKLAPTKKAASTHAHSIIGSIRTTAGAALISNGLPPPERLLLSVVVSGCAVAASEDIMALMLKDIEGFVGGADVSRARDDMLVSLEAVEIGATVVGEGGVAIMRVVEVAVREDGGVVVVPRLVDIVVVNENVEDDDKEVDVVETVEDEDDEGVDPIELAVPVGFPSDAVAPAPTPPAPFPTKFFALGHNAPTPSPCLKLWMTLSPLGSSAFAHA
ncbi:MAG: hypothetical protein M1820_003245 [Bogoriella megaspora]|nr:MAG: hypothetical protein M1820_003245 [Bogoriella megaspora]